MYVLVGGNRSYDADESFILNNKIFGVYYENYDEKMAALTVRFTAAIVKMSSSEGSLDSLNSLGF